MGNIQIVEVGEPSPHVDCAGRIARLLEIALQDSVWLNKCDGTITLTHYLVDDERIIIKGTLSGIVNGENFLIPFETDHQIDIKLNARQFAASPILTPLLAIFRASYYEQDPEKLKADWLTRSELEIASKLEGKLNKLGGAPLEGIGAVWRQALVAAGILLILVPIALTIYAYGNPKPNRMKDPRDLILLNFLGSLIMCGGPAATGTIFLRLIFIRRDMEETVSGQALLRFIGVKSALGLRILSVVAAIVCFGIAANFARLLVLP